MSRLQENEGMSLIVRTVSMWTRGFILLYGVHIVLYGHLTPGGGFAGGVIAASAFVLIWLAEGRKSVTQVFPRNMASKFDSVGVLIFWLMAMLGLAVAGTFFFNFWTTPPSARLTLISSGIILPSNLGIGLKVCCSLYIIVLAIPTRHRKRKPKENEEALA